MERFDVIIVDPGALWIFTALNLHKLSDEITTRTLILEKMKHPRERCGKGISANSSRLLKELNLRVDIPHVDVDQVRLK